MKTEPQDKFKRGRTMMFFGVALICAVVTLDVGPVTATMVMGIFLLVYGACSSIYHAHK